MALAKYFHKPTISEHLEEQRKKLNPTTAPVGHDVTGKSVLPLGKLEDVDHEFYLIDTGIYTPPEQVVLDEKLLDTHIAVIGATNSGKSSGLLRIIAEIARTTDRIIVVVDGGGDPKFAARARAVMYPWRGDVPILRLGYGTPGKGYNGFKGDTLSLENRLAGLVGVPEKEGNAIYHASNERVGIGLLCNAKAGPPRSLVEVEERLHPDWLKNEYAGTSKAWRAEHLLRATSSGTPYKNMSMQLVNIIDQLRGFVREDGHSLEDGSCIFSIDTPKIADTSKRFFPFLIEDAKHCMGNRHDKKMVFVFDEYGAFEDRDLHTFASQARKHGNSVILATQSVVSLGPSADAREGLLANTTTVICFQTDYPDEICKRAGSKKAIHHSRQISDDGLTGLGNVQEEDVWKIPPADIKALDSGHAYIIRKGTWVRVHFNELKEFPAIPPEPDYSPPPPPAVPPPPTMDLK